MKIIRASHRAALVLTAAGSHALALLLLKPCCEGVHPGWLAVAALILTAITVLVVAIVALSLSAPSMHQALGGLLILTGIVLLSL